MDQLFNTGGAAGGGGGVVWTIWLTWKKIPLLMTASPPSALQKKIPLLKIYIPISSL